MRKWNCGISKSQALLPQLPFDLIQLITGMTTRRHLSEKHKTLKGKYEKKKKRCHFSCEESIFYFLVYLLCFILAWFTDSCYANPLLTHIGQTLPKMTCSFTYISINAHMCFSSCLDRQE